MGKNSFVAEVTFKSENMNTENESTADKNF